MSLNESTSWHLAGELIDLALERNDYDSYTQAIRIANKVYGIVYPYTVSIR